jgi:integrase/recombinase XerC
VNDAEAKPSAGPVDAIRELVRQLRAFTDAWPWEWTPAHFERWSAAHLKAGRTPATLRTYQNAVYAFCAFVSDPRYQWGTVCERLFGRFPIQICHELNMVRHATDYEGRPDGNRPLSKAELDRSFAVANERVARARRAGRKGELAAYRDAVLYLTILGWGIRRTEASFLNVTDWRANAAHPQFGGLGQLVVRRGNTTRRRAHVLGVLAAPQA